MALCRTGGKVRRQGTVVMLVALALLALPGGAPAQTPGSGFSSLGGSNSKKPIDIESDRLEVDDQKHVAIFSGNVSATQGDHNLRAPRLEVTYDKTAEAAPQDQGGAKAAKPIRPANTNANSSADPLSSGQIKFIHASGGKVVVTSKVDDQEATGDDVIYDVKGQKITMTGKEVVLTQKKSVVKGRQIDIDLATGRATVIPEHGRVRAILTQDDAKGSMSTNPLTGARKKDTDSAAEAPKSSSGVNGPMQNH
ncbi:MAG TPA: LptA/OstA family protein [Geobacterales bacterium]|nr:LptA/OstA family protein [Geobacterales bacterium]